MTQPASREPRSGFSGLWTKMAQSALDRRNPPPGHATFREPELSAAEWRDAYFALARIAQEQLDECRAALQRTTQPASREPLVCAHCGEDIEPDEAIWRDENDEPVIDDTGGTPYHEECSP